MEASTWIQLLPIFIIVQSLSGQETDKRIPPSIEHAVLDTLYYKSEQSVHLPCKASGYPAPSYTWIFNGKPLDINDPNIRPGEDGDIHIVTFSRFDEGYYQCKATNPYGASLSTVFYLQRARLSKMGTDEVTQYHGKVGEHLEVPITDLVLSVPAPLFAWQVIEYKNDPAPRLLNLSRRVIQSKEGSLIFTHLKLEDTMMVKLSSFNYYVDVKQGGSYSQINVEQDFPVTRGPKLIYPGTDNVIVLEGEDLELQCIFSGYPDVVVTWTSANNQPFQSHETNATLKVKNVTRDNEGTYACTGRNSAGSVRNLFMVDVQSRPKFAVGGRPENVLKSEGETVVYHCETTEDTEPEATITWLFNGEPIDITNPGPRTALTESNHVLTIIELKRDYDLRVVQCNASNVNGYAFADAVLNVIAETEITTEPKDQVLHANSSLVSFDCVVETDPLTEVNIKWLRDGRQVEDYQDPVLEIVNDRRRLLIHLDGLSWDERTDYVGEYSCTATNGHTTATASAYLDVPVIPAVFPWWIIILVVVIILLILLILLLYCCIRYLHQNREEVYLVDENERKQGNDPEKDLQNAGFHDYQRPVEVPASRKASRATLDERSILASVGEDSLAEYEDDIGNFSEDGSFMGNYNEDKRHQIKIPM